MVQNARVRVGFSCHMAAFLSSETVTPFFVFYAIFFFITMKLKQTQLHRKVEKKIQMKLSQVGDLTLFLKTLGLFVICRIFPSGLACVSRLDPGYVFWARIPGNAMPPSMHHIGSYTMSNISLY